MHSIPVDRLMMNPPQIKRAVVRRYLLRDATAGLIVLSLAALGGCAGWRKPEPQPKQLQEVDTLFNDRYKATLDTFQLLKTNVRATVPSPTGTLTPEVAIQSALGHNLSLVTQSESLAVAQANLVQAGLLPNPAVGQTGATYFPIFGGVEPITAFDVMISETLNDFLTLPHREAIAKAQQFQAGIDMSTAAFSMAQQTQQQYEQLVYLTRDGLLQRRIADTYEQAMNEARAEYKAGLVTRSDFNRAVVAYEDSLRQAHHYDTQYEGAARQMNWLMGSQAAPQWKLPDNIKDPPQVIAALPNQERLEDLAVHYRLDLLRAGYDRRLAEEQVQMARLGFIPQTTIGADFARDSNKNWTAGPNINSFLPIFDPGIVAFWLAKYQQEQAERTYLTLQGQVRQDVRNALNALQIAAEDVVFSRDVTIPREEENVKEAELSFRLGNSQFDDLLNTLREYVGVLQTYEDEIQAYQQAAIGLESAVGLAFPKIVAMSADVPGKPTTGPAVPNFTKINPIGATAPSTLPAGSPTTQPSIGLEELLGSTLPATEPALPGHQPFRLWDQDRQPTTRAAATTQPSAPQSATQIGSPSGAPIEPTPPGLKSH